jgi:hypothetical protein
VSSAVLVPARHDDYESVQMSPDPQFIALLKRSNKSIKEGGGFSTEEMRKVFKEQD